MRARLRYLKYLVPVGVVLLMICLVTYRTGTVDAPKLKLHPDVKVLRSAPPSLPYKDCVPLPRAEKNGTKICIYSPEEDRRVSKMLKSGSLWEAEQVKEMVDFLKSDTDIQLVDLGAKLGVFSISAASAGFDVLAVESIPTNAHMLLTSLAESGLQSKLTVVNNALYNRTNTPNVGGTELNFKNTQVTSDHVTTICMEDLVPLVKHKKAFIKMDIQVAETQAFNCSYEFFKQVDVRALIMEWDQTSKQDQQLAKGFFSHDGAFYQSLTVHSYTYRCGETPTFIRCFLDT